MTKRKEREILTDFTNLLKIAKEISNQNERGLLLDDYRFPES